MREDVEPELCTRASKHKEVCRWQNRAIDDDEVRAQAHCWHNPSGSDWGQPVKLELRPLPGPALPRPGQLLLDAQWGHARRLTGALPVTEMGSVGSRLRVLEGEGRSSGALCSGVAGSKRGAAAAASTRAGRPAWAESTSSEMPFVHMSRARGSTVYCLWTHTCAEKTRSCCGMRSSNPRGARDSEEMGAGDVPRAAGTVSGALLLSKETDRSGTCDGMLACV